MAVYEYGFKPKTSNKSTAVLFIIFGVILIFIGIVIRMDSDMKADDYADCTEQITAAVQKVDIKKDKHYSGGRNNGSTVSYSTTYNVSYSFDLNEKTYEGKYSTSKEIHQGDSIAVLYNTDDPNEHCAASEKDNLPLTKNAMIAVIAIGSIMAAAGLIKLIRSKQ